VQVGHAAYNSSLSCGFASPRVIVVPRIFISYRTADAETIAGRIYDNLKHRYGRPSVIIDYNSMIPGRDFRVRLAELLQQSDLLTAIVGPRWAAPRGRAKKSRSSDLQYDIAQAGDWVRFEIETALNRPIPVIPVLVRNAKMPKEALLPSSLKGFATLQAQRVNEREDFEPHIERLFATIDRWAAQSAGILANDGTGA
jgi:TIR domain